MNTKILLGTGKLTWDRGERISNRYGFVYLLAYGDSLSADYEISPLQIPPNLIAKEGMLVAVVKETRKSTHVGDFSRSLVPTTPNVHDVIVLGEGLLAATYAADGHSAVGLRPLVDACHQPVTEFTRRVTLERGKGYYQDKSNQYETSWLNADALYRVHEQTVELYFEPKS